MVFQAFSSIFRTIRTSHTVRRASALRLGITSRLVISIAAAAVLAATANMIARESVHVIHTVTRAPTVPQAAHVVVVAHAAVLPDIAPPKKASALTPALLGYQKASEARAARQTPAVNSDYLAAKDALQVATLEAIQGSTAARPSLLAAAQRVPDYIDRGNALIALGDRRRHDRAEYLSHLKSIVERVHGSLDRAWTLFGRVIARQSLVRLRADLDAINQHADAVLAGETGETGNLSALLADESRFSATLEANATSLEKSEGRDWVHGVREHFAMLVDLRGSLVSLNSQYDQAAQQFAQDGQLLSRQVTEAVTASQRADLASRARASPTPQTRGQQPPELSESALPVTSVTETTQESSNPGSAQLMANVTAVVMLLMLAISVLTVLSIVVPVRRLLKAAKQLANGDSNVSVARGGIKELDLVAQAFNDMAARLHAMQTARDEQQATLERTVLERTHKLQLLAQQDPLTSLPNRRHLTSLLNSAIERAAAENCFVGVYFLDIDNFKNINDTLGHVFGDRVLMSVANRLEELTDGFGFVARLGGDEFTIVYENAKNVNAIHEFGWAVARAFHKLVSVDDRELSVSVSVGASIFPVHEAHAEGLLRAADSALFRAKELGRSQLAVFTPELITSAAARFTVEQGLRRAIEHSEFELAYQPEINLATAEMDLVEALLRWRLPDGRIVKPGEFIAVAEQSGIIAEIDAWVLRAAVADASRWYHGGWPKARVAINVSARQLLDHRFVESALRLLGEFRLPAKCIELELTEMVFQTGPSTIAALRVLQSHGFGIALDDFGTGYSSLTSLEQLPLSRIKLDRSLVSRIDTSARSAAIARAIIDLCSGLRLEVTAEGIERPEQFSWFLANRAIFLQGYLLSEAVPFREVLDLKAALVGKVQDLLLSAPAVAQRRGVSLVEGKVSVSR